MMAGFAQAKHYISNRQQLRDMQCGICYELDPDMIRCKGSCKTVFCLHCITRSSSKNNSCPMRCSQLFQVETIPHLKIHFDCPYDKQQCKEIIDDSHKFRLHLRACEYISQTMLGEIQKANSFQCSNHHKLLFLNQTVFQKIYNRKDFYSTTMNQICSLCKSQTICTSICVQCSSEDKKQVFCIACRPLPCTKLMCPIGHLYDKSSVISKSMVCDFCGLNISMFGKQSYRDTVCNFDLCQNCHNQMPETHPLVPLQSHHYGVIRSSQEEEESSQQSFQQQISFEEQGSFSNSFNSDWQQVDIDSNNPQQDLLDEPNEEQQQSLQDYDHNFGSDYFDQE